MRHGGLLRRVGVASTVGPYCSAILNRRGACPGMLQSGRSTKTFVAPGLKNTSWDATGGDVSGAPPATGLDVTTHPHITRSNGFGSGDRSHIAGWSSFGSRNWRLESARTMVS